jgi:hypothetical protein
LTLLIYDLNCFTEVPEWRCAATKVNNAMATDYDAPRKTEEETPSESLEALQASRGGGAQTAVIDLDENDTAEGIDLPGADLSNEELTVIVVPEQSDEFTCWLVLPGPSPVPGGQGKERHEVLPRLRRLNSPPRMSCFAARQPS